MHWRTFWAAAVIFTASTFGHDALPRAAAADAPGLTAERPASGRYVATPQGFMVPYVVTIPGTEVTFEMQPVPGGVFHMGSPEAESGRSENEGPQVEVEIPPFWIASREVSWAEYKAYMAMHDIFKKFQKRGMRKVTEENRIDAITAPSNLYDPSFTFAKGEDLVLPAVTMSQYAAKQYTKWLSGFSGEFYRLPSEAEWEYACRAGAKTAYHFGDDPALLGEYAWFADNASELPHAVGVKKPNAWGLHDMHGNVGEWVLDELAEGHYATLVGKPTAGLESVRWPDQLYPRVIRGGSWQEQANRCRAAARRGSSDDDWRSEDPNVPLSPWWFTSPEALSVGFRVLRPLDAPLGAERERFWKADIEQIQEDVDFRIEQEGRGAVGIVDRDLPKAIQEVKRGGR